MIPTPAPSTVARKVVLAYEGIFLVVLSLLMAFGVVMRLSQGAVITLAPAWFYRLMTAHGAGMVGVAALGGSAILWYFLSQYAPVSRFALVANLGCFLAGAVLLLAGVLGGGFAGGWTFLYPLPAHSNGQWGTLAAAGFLGGLLLIGVGFLVFFVDVALALREQYGSLARVLGWPQLFRGSTDEPPPPTVVASAVTAIVNIVALVVGAAIIAMELYNLFVPAFTIDALWAKNLTFLFGHVFINATMYMGVIAVYEILPRYANRPWKTTKPLLAAWNASLLIVLAVYPHHLLMDFVMPTWMLVMGQLLSWASGFPILVVTTIAVLHMVRKSGLKWDAVSALLFLSVFGWAAGVIPAILDGTIAINRVMHNTLWVPGHFHFYLVLGTVAMNLAFALWLTREPTAPAAGRRVDVWLYALGGLGLAFSFLVGGPGGVPRRFAVHEPAWRLADRAGSLFAMFVLVATIAFAVRYFSRLRRAIRADTA